MGLKKVYNKTEFFNHARKVVDIPTLYNTLSKHRDDFSTVENDIETVTDMASHIKADLERAKAKNNTAAVNSLEDDMDRNNVLLEEHQADRRKIVSKVIAEFDRLSFPKMA